MRSFYVSGPKTFAHRLLLRIVVFLSLSLRKSAKKINLRSLNKRAFHGCLSVLQHASLLFLMGLSWSAISQSHRAQASEIEVKLQEAQELLENSRDFSEQCEVKITQSNIQLCTEVTLDLRKVETFLNSNLETCLAALKTKSYKVSLGTKPYDLNEDDYTLFLKDHSASARTFPQQKIVAFKEKSPHPITCFHEYLHVLQWEAPSSSPKSSPYRHETAIQLLESLRQFATQAEDLFKRGQKAEALQLEDKIKSIITAMQDLRAINEAIDEIEVYQSILLVCERFRTAPACTETQTDVALANLNLRQSHLSEAWREKVTALVKLRVRNKKADAMKRVAGEWKKSNLAPTFSNLIQMSDESLISEIRKHEPSLHVYFYSTGKGPLPGIKPLASSVLKQLAKLDATTQKRLGANSHIFSGQALGRFTCLEKKRGALVLTEAASRQTLIHEFGHWLQSKNNPRYCSALHDQTALQQLHQSGQLSKQEFEETVLDLQALNALAEIEVYETLLSLSDPSTAKLETINNQENLKKYKEEFSL